MLEKKHHQTFVQTEQNLFFLQVVNFLKQLYVLIKPGVISLVIFTALCAMLLAPSDKTLFIKATAKSFDYAILEKTKQINAIKLDIPWSDLGSWKEILKMYDKNKNKYIKKKNIFYRPWGKYTNLFEGKEFLIKELYVKPKGILSLQKHHHRAEHWLVTQGNAKITLNKDIIIKKPGEHIFIPLEAIHRVQNPGKKPVKIVEAQIGSILKESDIVRYQDVYGRVK